MTLALTVISVATPGINDISIPLVGVPLTAITMSAAGAACSFAWPHSHKTTRGKLFLIALASTIAGASAASVFPEIFGRHWPKELQAPLAFFFGMLAPWVIPAIRSILPTFFRALAAVLVRMFAGKIEPPRGDDDAT
jgi:hypothetical protein